MTDHNHELARRSGQVQINSRLVSFLYELMRDHMTAGEVEALVRACDDPDVQYTNGWLALYAQDLAARLTDNTPPVESSERTWRFYIPQAHWESFIKTMEPTVYRDRLQRMGIQEADLRVMLDERTLQGKMYFSVQTPLGRLYCRRGEGTRPAPAKYMIHETQWKNCQKLPDFEAILGKLRITELDVQVLPDTHVLKSPAGYYRIATELGHIWKRDVPKRYFIRARDWERVYRDNQFNLGAILDRMGITDDELGFLPNDALPPPGTHEVSTPLGMVFEPVPSEYD